MVLRCLFSSVTARPSKTSFFAFLRSSSPPRFCDLMLGDGSATQDLVGDNKTSGVVGMPFHLNNVDMTVISNFLYGTSQVVLEELNGGAAKQYFISHPDFQQVYENSAQAIRSGTPPHRRTRNTTRHAHVHSAKHCGLGNPVGRLKRELRWLDLTSRCSTTRRSTTSCGWPPARRVTSTPKETPRCES
jgi:hypothetical protein